MFIQRFYDLRDSEGFRRLRARLIRQTESFVLYGISVRRYEQELASYRSRISHRRPRR